MRVNNYVLFSCCCISVASFFQHETICLSGNILYICIDSAESYLLFINQVKILAFDTSADSCSVALNLDGQIFSRFEHAPRRHTELLLPMIDGALLEAQVELKNLDALAFGRGPGSFTGVRIATGVAQGIAFGADLPVAPVSTLAALALRSFREEGERRILAAFDARMSEVYWGGFIIDSNDWPQLQGQESVSPPNAVSMPEGSDWHGAGEGWKVYGDELQARVGENVSMSPELKCRADEIALIGGDMFLAGDVVTAEQALPVYLRDEVAWKKQPVNK